jgi:hypothetical protein
MTGLRGKIILALLVVLGMTSSADAFFWRWRYAPYYSGYYYPYAYAYSYPYAYSYYPVCAATYAALPRPVFVADSGTQQAKPEPYAPAPRPTQRPAERAPAPQSKEPPMTQDMLKKGPTVTESRSLGGTYAVGSIKDRCKVGFWNLTGRDVWLKIDNQLRMLPKDRAITLDLDRSFAYQVDESQTIAERVAADQPFHEVILRQ